jgi:hypothetical protein
MSEDQAPAGYDIVDGKLVPKPPSDTAECVFACRAVDQIAKAQNVSTEDARRIAVEAIDRKKLELRARIVREPMAVREPDSVFAHISPTTFTLEGWAEYVVSGRFDWIDERRWLSVRQRRRIPVPHWLFVTRKSLADLLVKPRGSEPGPPQFKDDKKQTRDYS